MCEKESGGPQAGQEVMGMGGALWALWGPSAAIPHPSLCWISLSFPFPKAKVGGRSPCPPFLVLQDPHPTLKPSCCVGSTVASLWTLIANLPHSSWGFHLNLLQ